MSTANLTTALFDFHVASGAKMVPFAGYEMPIQYATGIVNEHNQVRQSAGIFDVSHMGQFSIVGDDSVCAAIEKVIPIDLSKLNMNQSKYSFLMNAQGGIDDDLIVTRVEQGINIVLNAACKHKDVKTLKSVLSNPDCATLHDHLSLVAIQGPKAVSIVDAMIPGVANLKFMNGGSFMYEGENVYVTRSGYTGEDGFEISIANDKVEQLCKTLVETTDASMIGLGARDSLRLEAGLCLYGHDLDTTTSPIEADLLFGIAKSRREQFNFIGGDVVKQHMEQGISRKRVGIQLEGKIIARENAKIFQEDKEVGIVTSGSFGPSVGAAVVMGYVNFDCSEVGTSVELEVRGKKYPAKICLLPFYKKSYAK
ncbi:glycine cleavage system aminomethyltransferase GcvT [Pelagibacteraceae bacterium]|nr:glycine cleavage system aminomethyltransferase GcvT [Pelagibacteraceae bacterium]